MGFLSVGVIVLAGVGLWISAYFTGVYYKWFSPDVRWVPKVCRLQEKSCLDILDTPRAKLFSIPNSAFGLVVYTYLIIDQIVFDPSLGFIFLAFALLRSIYLAYSLLFVTKIPCPLCFTSHGINFILFMIYLKWVF